MILKVEIENFQSHKKTTVDFEKGLNVITGSGDQGKSAILKAIFWVITNKPDGDEFISHWVKKNGKPNKNCSVTIYTEKGYVKRVKGKDNYYDVNGNTLTAFGRNVPEEVTDFLNLGDLNIQTQFESHFLLSESDSEVSRVLNSITNLDIIDTTLSNANTFIRSAKSKEKHISEDISATEAQLESFQGIEKVGEDITKIRGFQDERSDLVVKQDKLNSTIKSINDYTSSLESFPDLDLASAQIKDLDTILEPFKSNTQKIKTLSNLIEQIKNVRKTYIGVQKAIKAVGSSMDEIISDMEKLKDVHSGKANLKSVIASIENKESVVLKQREKLNELEEQYSEFSDSVCPLCEGSGKL